MAGDMAVGWRWHSGRGVRAGCANPRRRLDDCDRRHDHLGHDPHFSRRLRDATVQPIRFRPTDAGVARGLHWHRLGGLRRRTGAR